MENLTERERQIIAIALFANGASHERIGELLDVTSGEAIEIATAGAELMGDGVLGYMGSSKALSVDSSE